MSQPEEPARLVTESSGASAELRRALGAARGDLPSPDHIEAMLARFPFPDGGGGGGGDTGGGGPEVGGADVAAGAAKSAAIGKWVGIGFLVASAGTVFYAKTTIPPHEILPTSSAVASASVAPSVPVATVDPVPAEPPAVESSAPSVTPSASSAPHTQPSLTASASEAPSASASSGPPRSEVEILKEAHAARSNPSRMLELVNEHAKLYPKGMLGQEREILRIEALVGLGKRAEAKALADAFRKGNPSSVYAERLNQILPP